MEAVGFWPPRSRAMRTSAFRVRYAKREILCSLSSQSSVFEAASLSKPVFTYGVLKPVDQGKLDLDTPLSSYLPKSYVPDERVGKITARLVLSHRTGFPNCRHDEHRFKKPSSIHVICHRHSALIFQNSTYRSLQILRGNARILPHRNNIFCSTPRLSAIHVTV